MTHPRRLAPAALLAVLAVACGGDDDIALDRAGARCTELGATNDFPQQP